MKSVAIVGFSQFTSNLIEDSQADELWTLNHAFVLGERFPRIDRLFELHKYGWALRKGEHRLDRYYNYLRRQHDYPIYMQKKYKSFPSSVQYPLEEINKFAFSNLLRNGEPNIYYTSTIGYMLAMAVYEGFDTIEIHGIDMTNETEYNYQKPAGEWMIGFAVGKGVKVILHPDTALCKAQLYGYDRVPAASRERAVELLDMYQSEHKRYHAEHQAHAEKLNHGLTRDASGFMQAVAYASMYSGAMQYLDHQLTGDEYYFGRQKLENDRRKYWAEEERLLATSNHLHAVFETYSQIDTNGQAGEKWQEYLRARNDMFAYSGARQTIQKLLDECDMKVVPDTLRLEIRDDQ